MREYVKLSNSFWWSAGLPATRVCEFPQVRKEARAADGVCDGVGSVGCHPNSYALARGQT